MLRFFRQLRHRLLPENRVSRYLLYAVGEILLVVVGILIALQIDNWKEKRQQDGLIRLELTNLLNNLKGDRGGLEEAKIYHAFRVHASYYLLRHFGISENVEPYPEAGPIPELREGGIFGGPIPDTLNRAFVVRAFSWLVRYNAPRVNTNAMDEFKSTGLFAKFENQALKDEIQSYYAHFAWVFPLGDNRDSSPTILLRNALLSKGYSYLDVAGLDNPVQVLLSDPTCVALLKNIIDDSTFQSNEAASILEQLERLMQKIEMEIAIYSSE